MEENIFTVEYINKITNNLGLKIAEDEPNNAKQKFALTDKEGYYYFSSLSDMKQSIKQGYLLAKFHRSNPYTIYNVKLWLVLNKIELKLVSDIYSGGKQKLIFKDAEGYFYLCKFGHIIDNHIPSKFGNNNPYTIQNIKLWCKLENKSFKLISHIYNSSNKKLKWKCLTCGEMFENNWNNIHSGQICGYCTGQQVGISNCLAAVNPILASEWHPIKNGKFMPDNFTSGSDHKAWWKCSTCGYEWESIIGDRNSGRGCPKCAEKNSESKYQEKTRLYINELGYKLLHEKNCTLNPRNPISPPINSISNKQRRKGVLRYDNEIIIDNNHIFIEVHGEQHDSMYNIYNIKGSNKHNTTPREELEYLKSKDSFKEKYVYMQGENYYYLAIWYYDFNKEDTYKTIINNKISEILKIDRLQTAI